MVVDLTTHDNAHGHDIKEARKPGKNTLMLHIYKFQ